MLEMRLTVRRALQHETQRLRFDHSPTSSRKSSSTRVLEMRKIEMRCADLCRENIFHASARNCPKTGQVHPPLLLSLSEKGRGYCALTLERTVLSDESEHVARDVSNL